MIGAMCIHPQQVGILNEVFSPSDAEIEYVVGLLSEYACAEAEGRGAFAYRGKMIDAPVVARARELLARHLSAEQRRQSSISPSSE
jgi:citrate lyase subunit beta/citryl-CoA lyase